ncbi:hypothetical protein V6N13_061857 [Hibiscus sabdariffa]
MRMGVATVELALANLLYRHQSLYHDNRRSTTTPSDAFSLRTVIKQQKKSCKYGRTVGGTLLCNIRSGKTGSNGSACWTYSSEIPPVASFWVSESDFETGHCGTSSLISAILLSELATLSLFLQQGQLIEWLVPLRKLV